MKILVTGGLGFIGSNLIECLVAERHEVSGLDNLHTGSESNVNTLKNQVKIIRGNASLVSTLTDEYDMIFHQGIYSSAPMYKDNPVLIARVIEDWINILDYARKNNIKIVYASTSSLYNRNTPPHKEDMQIYVTDFYAEARNTMERLAILYDQLYGVQSIGLRYFSVYGPREKSKGHYANLVSQFLWDMLERKQPVIYGDGYQTRDFTYVSDVVAANMLAMKYGKTDVFNVGTGRNTTLNDVVAILNNKLNTNIEPKYVPNKIKNYVQETLADTKKTEALLGFKAKISLGEGIDQLIKYYSSSNGRNNE